MDGMDMVESTATNRKIKIKTKSYTSSFATAKHGKQLKLALLSRRVHYPEQRHGVFGRRQRRLIRRDQHDSAG